MRNVRCRCGKIICQAEKLLAVSYGEGIAPSPQHPAVVILCRHCKRYVVLHLAEGASFQPTDQECLAEKAHVLSARNVSQKFRNPYGSPEISSPEACTSVVHAFLACIHLRNRKHS